MITLTNRGVTTAFNYVILLGITSLLVAGLITGVSGLVSSQETDAIHTEFKVHGNQLAADISTVSHLANRTDGTVSLTRDLPQRVVGNQYTISISHETGNLYQLTMSNEDPAVLVTVRFKVQQAVDVPDTLNGGPLNISATGSEEVTVTNE